MQSYESEHAIRQYPKNPRVGVGVLVFRGDEFVLVKRDQEPSKGLWTFPGGLVELGETVREAAQRELEEECNIKAEIKELLEIFEFIQRDKFGQVKYHYVVLDFYADYFSGELKAKSDIAQAVWIRHEKLDDYYTTESVKKIVSKAHAAKFLH